MSDTLLEDAVNGRVDWNDMGPRADLVALSTAISTKRIADALELIAKHLEPPKHLIAEVQGQDALGYDLTSVTRPTTKPGADGWIAYRATYDLFWVAVGLVFGLLSLCLGIVDQANYVTYAICWCVFIMCSGYWIGACLEDFSSHEKTY